VAVGMGSALPRATRRWYSLPIVKRMAPRWLLAGAALALLASFALAGPAFAQVGERIRSYRVDIAIRPDGTISVDETIDYDFGDTSHHGIERDIPYRFYYDQVYDRVEPIEDVSVTASAGTPDKVKTSKSGGTYVIRIGDPNRTITGLHEYRIHYVVRGALNAFRDH